MVTVASKLHHGFDIAPGVYVNGTQPGLGRNRPCPVENGYALTSGIDKAVWDAWHAANIESGLVKAGWIYAADEPQTEAPVAEPAEAAEPVKPRRRQASDAAPEQIEASEPGA